MAVQSLSFAASVGGPDVGLGRLGSLGTPKAARQAPSCPPHRRAPGSTRVSGTLLNLNPTPSILCPAPKTVNPGPRP
jgi:hypothetical protein